MFGFELPEILIIALVAGFLFGPDKLGSLAKSLGRFSGEFTKGRKEVENELRAIKDIVHIESD